MKPLDIDRRNCAVCGGSETELLFRQQFQGIGEASIFPGYDVVCCKTCGFCFAQDLPSQTTFDTYYRQLSKYEHQDRAGQASEFEQRQFPLLAQSFASFLPDRSARVLEIGCANGGLLNALKQLGYNSLLGVDPSPVCASNAERLYGVRVLTSALSELPADLGPFELIVMVAVLEHIRDLDGALRRLRGLLSDSGMLYLDVPDATRFKVSADAPFQEFSIEHINFFTSASLRNLTGTYGMSEVSSGQAAYLETDTHTGYAIQKVLKKSETVVPIVHDPTGAEALKQYIAASQAIESRIHRVVDELVRSGQPLIVWGVGTHTQRLLAVSTLSKANITAFVDSNPNYQGKTLNGKPILPPAELVHRNDAILVSSRIFQSEIVDQIRSGMRLSNTIYTLYED